MAKHVLQATDNAIRAFIISEGVVDTSRVFTFKGVDENEYPFVVCASTSADRLRAKNWKVSGEIVLCTSHASNVGEADDRKEESESLETDLLEAFEQYVPGDDTPQQLAAAIQAAAIAADTVEANEYLMTSFYINRIDRDVQANRWEFKIDFVASVVG